MKILLVVGLAVLIYIGVTLLLDSTREAVIESWHRSSTGILTITIIYYPWPFMQRRTSAIYLSPERGWVTWPGLHQFSIKMQHWLYTTAYRINTGHFDHLHKEYQTEREN